jgi:hypothetical protein
MSDYFLKKELSDEFLERLAVSYLSFKYTEAQIEDKKIELETLYESLLENCFIPISLTEEKGDMRVNGEGVLRILKECRERLPIHLKEKLDYRDNLYERIRQEMESDTLPRRKLVRLLHNMTAEH